MGLQHLFSKYLLNDVLGNMLGIGNTAVKRPGQRIQTECLLCVLYSRKQYYNLHCIDKEISTDWLHNRHTGTP